MFKGNFTFTIDAKGRLSIPAKLRKYVKPEIEGNFTLTKGIEKCIYVYPADEWKVFEDRLLDLNPNVKEHAFIRRRFLQFAMDETLDPQNRLKIPKELVEYAGIKKDVFILGSLEKFELWNPDEYNNYLEKQEMPFEDVVEKVLGGGTI